MQEEEYTFVTIDNGVDDAMLSDAVIVDVDDNDTLSSDFVMLDDASEGSMDFITMDDSVMMSDADPVDVYSTDVDGSDISFII